VVTHRPGLDRIALISDVHGNLTALDAVLEDIDARDITRIFNLGDYVGKGPRGREVIDRCQERCEVNILGNWDDFLPNPDRGSTTRR
jgi:predicted phosphodiesterase